MSQALSLVVPAYNESLLIEKNLRRIIGFLESKGLDFELIVGDDGSEDDTAQIVERLQKQEGRLRLCRNRVHRGKGAILSKAFLAAKHDPVAFIDADLEIDIEHLGPMLEIFEKGSDIVIGSKLVGGEGMKNRSLLRGLMTRSYNAVVRSLFNSQVLDHQAGLKVFRRRILREILLSMSNEGWTWDTEVLLLAQSRGCRITETSIATRFRRASKVSPIRQPIEMAGEIIRFLWLRRKIPKAWSTERVERVVLRV